ncbi:MAG: hypothetical protein SVM80_10755 [Halobacteriota archaeon]|nr:hypothetical protein [Halobacteriota archaeon]
MNGLEYSLVDTASRLHLQSIDKDPHIEVNWILEEWEGVIRTFVDKKELNERVQIYQKFCDTYDEYVSTMGDRYQYSRWLMGFAKSEMELVIHEMEEASNTNSL